jgi:16S rRNA (uracil1498-N3)-methyltransferase
VLRLRPGEECEVAAEGRIYRARVTQSALEIDAEIAQPARAPTLAVWIAQPGARSDEAVEKLTELGVGEIGALVSERLKGRFGDSRLERWRRVAEAAAKQSKRPAVPAVGRVSPFADVLSPEAVVLSNTGASGGLADRLVGRRRATLLVGPEAGFSEAELELARSRGVAVATLGPVVLRTETAAVVAAALAFREMGFLG